MTLRAFIAKRIIYTIVLVLFVIILNFVIFEAMPGQNGVLYSIAGQRTQDNKKAYDHLVAIYHLNDSYQQRFVSYVTNLLTFNFGDSYEYHQPVLNQIVTSG